MTKLSRFQSFREFWPHYLSEHASPTSRFLHMTGTVTAAILLIFLMLTGNLWFLVGSLIAGYGFAWFGHFTIEHNRPMTFTHPIWSLRGDLLMFFLACTGNLKNELKHHGINNQRKIH